MKCPMCGMQNVAGAAACTGCKRRFVSVEALMTLDEQTGSSIGSVILLVICSIYVLLGPIDIIPDLFPVIGNLDDTTAVILGITAASKLGWIHFGRRSPNQTVISVDKSNVRFVESSSHNQNQVD